MRKKPSNDTLPSNFESFNQFESTAIPQLFISPTDEEFDNFLEQNVVAATAISSHINNKDKESNKPTSSTSTTNHKKRGRKPLSDEVKLQRAEEKLATQAERAEEKLAKNQTKKQRKNI